ncbi:MAG: hypothetical protein O7F76_11125 [Planctomycetota bacterium]|nr:hypothetical protein [Planctomycetota bacterium]
MMHPIRRVAVAALAAVPLFVGCGKENAGSVRDEQKPDVTETAAVAVASSNRMEPEPTPQPTARQPARETPERVERPTARETPERVKQPTARETPERVKRPTARELPPVRPPKRPVDDWVIFRDAFKPLEDAACDAEWTGGNRLVVETTNIRLLTVDLHKLPSGAPRRGPWNLQIDGQPIEITGFRGKIVDIIRSKNGVWTVDRSRRKMRR